MDNHMNLSSLPFTYPRYAPMIPTSHKLHRGNLPKPTPTHIFCGILQTSNIEPRLYPPPHAWHPLAAGQPHVHEAIAWLRCLPGVQSSFSWMSSRFQGMECLHLKWQGYWKHVLQKPTTVYMWSVIGVCDMDHDIIRHCLHMCQKMSTLVQTSCVQDPSVYLVPKA